MSVLAKIRGELLVSLNQPDVRIKKALIALYDAIDSDLDVGYTPSSSVEDCLDEYNNALAGQEDEEMVPEAPFKFDEVDVPESEEDAN